MKSKNLTIAVLGSNGRTGQIFVDNALKCGYSIRAGVHDGSFNFDYSPNLTVLKVDGTNSAEVDKLVKGSDVVVSLIGRIKNSPTNVQSLSIKNVLFSMEKYKINRLISLTGTGVRLPNDKIRFTDKIVTLFMKLSDPNRLNDGIKHVKILKSSSIDYTVIRVSKLNNRNSLGNVKLSEHGPPEIVTPRSRVSKAIIQVIEENSFIKKMPIISGVS